MEADSLSRVHKQAEHNQKEHLKKVENVNRELKEFVSKALHDLQEPLHSIEALANCIISDCGNQLGDQAKKQMNTLLKRVERMNNLIESTLQYSRFSLSCEKRNQVDLNNIVPEIIDMVVPINKITVTIENELPVIEGEEEHIIQIFQNLLSNAIKFMDKPHGWIKIGCIEQNDFWKFSITDNGPGIEKKHFEKIFNLLHTSPSSLYFASSGIGLTITKKIVELYNGKIWIESNVGEGSSFIFTLPKQLVCMPI